MANAYPGPGRILPRATYSGTTYPEPTWQAGTQPAVAEPTILNGGFSYYDAVDDAQEFRFMIQYASAPGATTTIEIAPDPTFADVQTLDTIPAASGTEKTMFWTTADNVMYSGCIRIKNTSGVTITKVNFQKMVSTSIAFSV